ncbi:MAG TPA: lysylphosphatidylglycerol synthase transmembrane domain-containing protein [Solirubrobacterales bacterium]|nr:lysylphosphatidylglycerol synthase transmembrane domain-containing protein [Solirubrobacterales bacterium]
MLQFVEPTRERDCTAEADAAREKSPDSHTILVNGALAAGLAVIAAAAVVWVPFLEPIRNRFADTDPGWVVATFVLQLLSVLSFVVALRGAFDRRLGWRESFDVGVVEESANVFLPSGGSGGLALGAVILIRSGIPTAFAVKRSAVLFLVTTAVSASALILFGALEAADILPGDAPLLATLLPAGIAAVLFAAVILVPRTIPPIDTERGGKIRRGAAAAQAWLVAAVDKSAEMVGSREMLLILGAIGYYAFDVASMGAAFEALGGGAPALGLFVLAYTIGHGGAIIPLPGSAEGGLVGAFTLYGSSLSLAVGGILLYRVFHAGVPFLLGALGLADMGRHRGHEHAEAEAEEVEAITEVVEEDGAPAPDVLPSEDRIPAPTPEHGVAAFVRDGSASEELDGRTISGS